MLVDWASASYPLFFRSLSLSLEPTMFAIKVTTGYRCDRSLLIVVITSGSGV